MGRHPKLSRNRRKHLEAVRPLATRARYLPGVEDTRTSTEQHKEFDFTSQSIFETNEKTVAGAISLPAADPMLFTFAVLVSGCSFARANYLFLVQ